MMCTALFDVVFNTSTLSGARVEIPIELLCEDGIDGASLVVLVCV